MGTHGAASVRSRASAAGDRRANSADPTATPGRLLNLSDWPVSRRLFTVIALALVMGLVFGGLRIADAEGNAAQFGRTAQLAALSVQLTTLVDDLQNERDATMPLLQAGNVKIDRRTQTPLLLVAPFAKTSADAAVVAQSAGAVATGAFPANIQADAARVQAEAGTGSIGGLHAILGSPVSDIVLVAEYAAVINDMTTLASQVAQGVSDAQLSNDVLALHALALAKEQVSQQRGLLNFALVVPPAQTAAGLFLDYPTETTLRTSFNEEVTDEAAFQAAGSPQERAEFNAKLGPEATRLSSEIFTDTVENQVFADASGTGGVIVAQAGIPWFDQAKTNDHPPLSGVFGPNQLNLQQTLSQTSKLTLSPTQTLPQAATLWNEGMSAKVGALLSTEHLVNSNILARAVQLQQGSKKSAETTAVVTLAVLLLVLFAALLVARSLVFPLRKLRASALNIASVQLPERVRELSASPDAATDIRVHPIDVRSADEIGQVARAFDQVHAEAVRLASEEAVLRTSFNAMFVNLSRRSQSLIERLARMIDGLEQTEEDPERLSGLFSMDHLVTRMRRNSENLLLLAGHENPRKWSESVPLADVSRAATSEIEQYNRVVMSISPGVAVIGQAVSDVVHLLAELIENATIFSPKDTPVQVTAQELSSGGVLIEVTDKGIGVSEARLADMNWRLDNPPVMDVSVSRHMGLFAVARLAERHRVRVRLRPASPQGLTALVWLPESVIERTNRITTSSFSTQPVGAGARRAVGQSLGGQSLGGQSLGGQNLGGQNLGGQRGGQSGKRAAITTGPHEQLREDAVGAGYGGGGAQPRQSSGWFRGRSGTPVDPGAGAGNGAAGIGTAGNGATGYGAAGKGATGSGAGGTGGYDTAGWGTGGWGEGRNPADVIADPVYGGETPAGLPLRTPKANLIPGTSVSGSGGTSSGTTSGTTSTGLPSRGTASSGTTSSGLPTRGAGRPAGPGATGPGGPGGPGGPAGRSGGPPPSMPQRSPERARSRLSGFQRGTQRAEEQAGQAPTAGEGSER
jgi:signal transduction histidine kinase